MGKNVLLYRRNGYYVLDNIVEVGGDVLLLYRSIGYSVNDNHKNNVITPNTEVHTEGTLKTWRPRSLGTLQTAIGWSGQDGVDVLLLFIGVWVLCIRQHCRGGRGCFDIVYRRMGIMY